jgi:hypothetical protein
MCQFELEHYMLHFQGEKICICGRAVVKSTNLKRIFNAANLQTCDLRNAHLCKNPNERIMWF